MKTVAFTCPRCFYTGKVALATQFCPRCGLANALDAAFDSAPIELRNDGQLYRVHERIAIGSISTVYRCVCTFANGLPEREATLKFARDPSLNVLLLNEASVLRRLHASADLTPVAPFLPHLQATLQVGQRDDARLGNVLWLDDGGKPGEPLYTLAQVRAVWADGLDARNMAWIWRRLLNVLAFVHAQGVVHAAVLPDNVLVQPKSHKLYLIDWCCGAIVDASNREPVTIVSRGHLSWYKKQAATQQPPSPALDLALAVRTMLHLLGIDPLVNVVPADRLEAALARYFDRCLSLARAHRSVNEFALLADFDTLIEALWGPRSYTSFDMPPLATHSNTVTVAR